MKKVLLLENIDQKAVEYLRVQGYEVLTVDHALNEEELSTQIKDVAILGIRSKTRVTQSVIRKAKKLKVVGAFCIGTDQIDLPACKAAGIAVFNAPFSNTRSVAELALGEIIMLSRNIFDASTQLHQGIWQKSAKGSHEVRGKTLGIIGYGHIGSQLSVLAEALGMKVIYYDVRDCLPLGNAQKYQSMSEVLQAADIVSVHVDGRKENTTLIGTEEFKLMKEGALFLNLSRGKIVDLNDLADAIKKDKIAGAAIDVFLDEPKKNGPGFASPLRGLPNVILTPHIAGSTEEAQSDIASFVSKKLHDYLSDHKTDLAVVIPERKEVK